MLHFVELLNLNWNPICVHIFLLFTEEKIKIWYYHLHVYICFPLYCHGSWALGNYITWPVHDSCNIWNAHENRSADMLTNMLESSLKWWVYKSQIVKSVRESVSVHFSVVENAGSEQWCWHEVWMDREVYK